VGYRRALAETARHWRPRPRTAATFRVPEAPITETVRRSLQFAEVIAEKNPATGKTCMLSGSFVYANLWTTPAAMALVMMLDGLGYHDVVDRYLAIFREEQGNRDAAGQRLHAPPRLPEHACPV